MQRGHNAWLSLLETGMRLSWLLFAALLVSAACSSTHGGASGQPPGNDSGSAGSGGFVFDAGLSCVDAGQDRADAGACTPSRNSVSFSADVEPILSSGCSGEVCHGTTGWGDYAALTAYRSRECCDGRPLVVPGDPDGSYLMHKLSGHGMCTGVPMPKNASPLPPAQMQTLYDWICLGAPNN